MTRKVEARFAFGAVALLLGLIACGACAEDIEIFRSQPPQGPASSTNILFVVDTSESMGRHERLPSQTTGLSAWCDTLRIYRKSPT